MTLRSTIGIFFIAIALTYCGLVGPEAMITPLDFPRDLSGQVDTIEVTYITWACACANWLPDKHFDVNKEELSESPEDYCIFIEAEKEGLKIPDEYHLGGYQNRIKLIGRFYRDKGISRDYESPTSQKPEKAGVFRYSAIEVIKPYTIWDIAGKDEPRTKTISEGMKAFYE